LHFLDAFDPLRDALRLGLLIRVIDESAQLHDPFVNIDVDLVSLRLA